MKKRCFKCGEVKELRLFYKHKRMGDGHLGKCKNCTKRDVNERYQDPIAKERIREYERLRFNDPKRKENILKYARGMRERNKGKTRARRKVATAIRNGLIIRKPCEICGEKKSQGHHTDYRKPLNVRWLCFKHHREEHGQIISKP